MFSRLFLIALLALLPLAYAEKITLFAPCSRARDFGTASIREVRITPCPESANRRPCILRKGSNVTIEVDMTPTVSANNILGRAFWANRVMELPLPNMNTNACESMGCPTRPNVPITYRYVLFVSAAFPTRRYDVRWKLTASPFNVCFQFPIQIVG